MTKKPSPGYEKRDIDSLMFYEKNAKKHPEKQVEQVAASIKEFGFNQPIVVDKKNVVIVGHGRLKAARLLGLKEVPVLEVGLTEEQAMAYRLADNKLNESEWDMDLVMEELKKMSVEMGELTGFELNLISEKDLAVGEYSKKIKAPIYEPSEEKPSLEDVVDHGKVLKLIEGIEKSKISKEEKEFLKYAAQRHRVFDYAKIAEFYAHSDKEVQKLMEDSALVIVDFAKAIEMGFVSLSEEISEHYLNEHGDG